MRLNGKIVNAFLSPKCSFPQEITAVFREGYGAALCIVRG
jgi:hypothetical protein